MAGGYCVKLDDMGYWLAEKRSDVAQGVGKDYDYRLVNESIIHCRYAGDVSGRRRVVVHGIAPLPPLNICAAAGAFMAHTIPAGLNLVLGFIIGAIVVTLVVWRKFAVFRTDFLQ